MNITYLIGNGFDISIGLKTKYSDFYPYYIKNSRDDSLIKSWMKKDQKNNQLYDKWSDLEETLGKYTKFLNKGQEQKYTEDYLELIQLLINYLKEQINHIDYKKHSAEIFKEMQKSLESYLELGSNADKQLIGEKIYQYQNQPYIFNFIVFNYTMILGRLIEICNETSSIISKHTFQRNSYNESIGHIVHVHGTLDNGLILGVNDLSQIYSDDLKNSDYSSLMIKKEMNATAGNGNDLRARQLINNSLIIVTYGLSIGFTDKDWWVYIINWLKQSNNRILIIHWYEPDSINESIPQTKFLKRRQIIARIKEVTEMGDVIDKLNERIIIYFNKNIFNFNLLSNDKICIA
ncbi:AbiH family protein [Massilimicrobiota sp. SW1139]|uniref:AbiH family protein n=1 Tax=Massilimicrobiota sp. SW1139 TaxID=2530043 RepID=UPI001438B213|nr:AbiH family protein [Massilimicrobiota sp. SW1139]NJE44273.1 hypothetical protein [Massilimicrobiota sp. SW1139]